jgi:transposase
MMFWLSEMPQKWDEKAGPPAGCVKLPIRGALEVQNKERPAMEKHTTTKAHKKALSKKLRSQIANVAAEQRLTIGLDLGDRYSRYCILDAAGDVISEGELPTTKPGLNSLFEKMPSSRVAHEVGTHSPWVSRHLAQLGHEVIVANPRQVALIGRSTRKDDPIDAQKLARLARVDPKLLYPIRHRGEQAQADLAVIRSRAALVEARTKLINAARGLAKSMGERLQACESEEVNEITAEELSAGLRQVLQPLLKSIQQISAQIAEYDQQIEQLASRYPEVKLLRQVYGVGMLVSTTYILTIEDPERFRHSREVGGYLGMVPKRRDSSQSEPELGISKEGDRLLRALLVQSAHCILRRGAPDSDLRRWGLAKIERGGKSTKKRVVVAVARKLAVLLHRLWVNGEVYQPLYNQQQAAVAA